MGKFGDLAFFSSIATGINETAQNMEAVQMARKKQEQADQLFDLDYKTKTLELEKAKVSGELDNQLSKMIEEQLSGQKKIYKAQSELNHSQIEATESQQRDKAKAIEHAIQLKTKADQVDNIASQIMPGIEPTRQFEQQPSQLNMKISRKIGDTNIEITPNSMDDSENLPQLEQDAPPEDKQAFLDMLPQGYAANVKGIADYKLDISKISSIRKGEREKLASIVTRYDPTFDMSQYNTRKNFLNNLANGQLSKGIVSANTLIGHIDSLKKAYDDLHNTQIPAWNYVENVGRRVTGSGKITAINTKASAVADELETLFRASGGTLEGTRAWRKNISENASPEQSQHFIESAIELMASRLKAIDSQYENVMGKPKNFSVLNGKSKKILQDLGINPDDVEYNPTPASAPEDSGGDPELEAKIQAARDAGYNDEEIQQYLESQK